MKLIVLNIVVWLLFALLPANASAASNKLNIAVASNFYQPLIDVLNTDEKMQSLPISLSSGATGVLYAQIKQGAPFDVFLSADSKRPRLLEQQGLASARQTYAKGQLVLWPANNINAQQDLLSFKHRLVIANPKLAPYGKAAEQFLTNHNLEKIFQHRLILANNVNQGFQFIYTKNAAKGILALSQLIQAQQRLPDLNMDFTNYTLIPKDSYDAIEQQLVLLNASKNKQLAKQFIEFVLSSAAQKKISSMGYITGDQ